MARHTAAFIAFATAAFACTLALDGSPLHASPPPANRVWYAANPGSLDLLRMFERPEEWSDARALIDVFQFTSHHTYRVTPHNVGPNTYDALVRSGAFRQLTRWGKKIATEVPVVKEHYCTDDPSGMNASIADTLQGLAGVSAAGGRVDYLAMDEPFIGGLSQRCGGPAFEPTADRLATYSAAVHRQYPLARIGLIEAYPTFKPADFRTMLELMQRRGIPPAFIHLDVDRLAIRPGRDDFASDVRELHALCRSQRVPLGIIIWGYSGESDVLFSQEAHALAFAFRAPFPTWDSLPEQLKFQSWALSRSGLLLTPNNLPEDGPYTLTSLLVNILRRLRGEIIQ
jgi:hypothetical protein